MNEPYVEELRRRLTSKGIETEVVNRGQVDEYLDCIYGDDNTPSEMPEEENDIGRFERTIVRRLRPDISI